MFISWAKEPSRTVAETLRDWLPDLVQTLQPWMSSADIRAGARWNNEVAAALATSRVGIICITPNNQQEPWLLFEAGAVAKIVEDSFVCPYLIGMRPSDLAPGPLTQFQAKTADHDGTFELVSTINAALGAQGLSSDRLTRLFERSWPDLESRLSLLPSAASPTVRPPQEMLAEILETVRSLARQLPQTFSRVPPFNRAWASVTIRRQLENLLPNPAEANSELVVAALRQMSDGDLERCIAVLEEVPKGGELPVVVRILLSSVAAAQPRAVSTERASELDADSAEDRT